MKTENTHTKKKSMNFWTEETMKKKILFFDKQEKLTEDGE